MKVYLLGLMSECWPVRKSFTIFSPLSKFITGSNTHTTKTWNPT